LQDEQFTTIDMASPRRSFPDESVRGLRIRLQGVNQAPRRTKGNDFQGAITDTRKTQHAIQAEETKSSGDTAMRTLVHENVGND
jgi:hypothetical protein